MADAPTDTVIDAVGSTDEKANKISEAEISHMDIESNKPKEQTDADEKMDEDVEEESLAVKEPPAKDERRARTNLHSHHKTQKPLIRSRFDNMEESNDEDEIRRQVEFYFSDSNLPIDEYLLRLVRGPINDFVPLKVIADFKRMHRFQPYSAVLEAVRKSTFLEVNDKEGVRRREKLSTRFNGVVEDNKKVLLGASMGRSIYAKGFGDEIETTQLDIEAFFQPFHPKSVRLRRHHRGDFKGSVFVEFHDEAAQQAFLEKDPKPKWNDKDLEIKSKQAYVEMKHDGMLDGSVRPRSPHRDGKFANKRGRGGHRGRGGRVNGGNRRDMKRNRSPDEDDEDDKDEWNKRRDRDNNGRGDRGGYKSNQRGGRGKGRPEHGERHKQRNSAQEDGKDQQDHDEDKQTVAANKEERTEGIAKRLEGPDAESGTKRSREAGDEDHGENDSKRAKVAVSTDHANDEA